VSGAKTLRGRKAVTGIGSGVALTNYLINDCVAGLMVADAHYQNFNILNNTMNKVMAGVQLLGNLHYASIKANNISLSELNAPINLGNNPIPDPRGVDIQFWTNIHNGQCSIEGNTMTIPGIRGMGVSLTKNGAQVAVAGNTVHFTTTNQTGYNPQLFTSPLLRGIYSTLGDGNQMRCNVVNGHADQLVMNNRLTQSMTLNQSRNAEVVCNQVNNARTGMLVAGDCQTGKEDIRSNIFSGHYFGLSTVPAVIGPVTGNLGDNIGIASQQDNNNEFNGLYTNPNGYRTYRFYSQATPYSQEIHTALNYDNGSNLTNPANAGAYFLVPAPNPETCQSLAGCGSQWEQIAPPNIDQGWALEVAEDSVQYYAYPEVSAWADKYNLYSDLERDSVLLASNAILASFYQTQQYQAIGLVRTAEQKLALLSDSTSRGDTLLFLQRLQDAKAAVAAMPDTTNYLYLEKWVTALFLHLIEKDRDSLSSATRDSLAWLANSCPAVEGMGVYKARVLQAYYTPLQDYNDYVLCNAANKGGSGLFDDLMKFFSGAEDTTGKPTSGMGNMQNPLEVFLNPTTGEVQFRFIEASNRTIVCKLTDILGREVYLGRHPLGAKSFQINLSGLPSGLYFYQVEGASGSYFGKIEKR